MRNFEKYKTAPERAEAFDRFCKSNITNEGMCMPDCKLFHAQGDSKCYCGHCEFHWLDIEAEEEKPLPCPFCGCKCESVDFSDYAEGGQVICENCDYQSRGYESGEKAIAAHNRVAKKCQEVK